MLWPGMPTTSAKFSNILMLGMTRSAIGFSVIWARKLSIDMGVVSVERPSRISTRTVSSPAFDSQKAVATPTMPPPTTTTSAVFGIVAVSGTKIFRIDLRLRRSIHWVGDRSP